MSSSAVWGTGDDFLALFVGLLPCVAPESHRRAPGWIAAVEELLELAHLAVGQGVHRVHDDGLDAFAAPTPKHVIDDRHDVREALARARARCEYVTVSGTCGANALDLVAV